MRPFDRLRWIMALRASAPIKAVLICLSLHANKQSRAWPSQLLIALETGLSIPTVKRALSEIRKATGQDDQSLVSVARRANRSTVYTLQFDGITMIPRWCHSDPRNSTSNSKRSRKAAESIQRCGKRHPDWWDCSNCSKYDKRLEAYNSVRMSKGLPMLDDLPDHILNPPNHTIQ